MQHIEYKYFLNADNLPEGFIYPNTYSNLVLTKDIRIEPWHFYYSEKTLKFHYNGLKERYPDRTLVPFARRGDNDDVACFDGTDISGDPRVIIIHDWASPGWENRGEFKNFLEWLECAKQESEEWKKFS